MHVTKQLDSEQVAAFHREGFLRLEGIAPPDDVRRIKDILDALFARYAELPEDCTYELGRPKAAGGPR